ncbi:HET-domain-containing protein [Tothia fuscella]|uniref:HET-domain-containing protein n=1 Tax=Tothia fuscella TaxID=1048955 RepID=A0A9P4NXH5_9PEZI|nr:HET-domain-containing protein [Tothia fuscella]
MRLLNASTLEMEDFTGDLPPYVILSHTWGKEEVLFHDLQASKMVDFKPGQEKAGFAKIQGTCDQAVRDRYRWVWIDTCCIDKTSSAELSEAINSMFLWYERADICYVYLADVPTAFSARHPVWDDIFDVKGIFKSSRCFTRGWTLQELVASPVVEFYAADWTEIGTKSSLQKPLSKITGIHARVLGGADPAMCSVAERMSWAVSRETTRLEDMAYSLLGLFHVNMPLLYGEGERAFVRLQEEILKISEDYSLFAWPIETDVQTQKPEANRQRGLLTTSITDFWTKACDWSFADFAPFDSDRQLKLRLKMRGIPTPPSVTGGTLRVQLPIRKEYNNTYSALLCQNKQGRLVCISLMRVPTNLSQFARTTSHQCDRSGFFRVPNEEFEDFKPTIIHVEQEIQRSSRMIESSKWRYLFAVNGLTTTDQTLDIVGGYSISCWRSVRDIDMVEDNSNHQCKVLLCFSDSEYFVVRFGSPHHAGWQHNHNAWCEIDLDFKFISDDGRVIDAENYAGIRQAVKPGRGLRIPKEKGLSDRASQRLRCGLEVRAAIRKAPSKRYGDVDYKLLITVY